jgi:SulP family sulfate permease
MLIKAFPGLEFLSWYRKSDFHRDIIAGLAVAVFLIPQGMAYALINGLPPVYGLYSASIPLLVYPLFGSSRHLSVGPAAIISLLTFVACSKYAKPGTAEFISLTITMTFLTGFAQVLFGFLKMGFIANFFSRAVSSGFISGGALLIVVNQLKYLFGIDLDGTANFPGDLAGIIINLGKTHTWTAVIGISSLLIIILASSRWKKVPASLIVVALGTLFVYWLRLDQKGIDIVGSIPRGLPVFRIPDLLLLRLPLLSVSALLIMLVGYFESLAMAQVISDKENYKINPDQELRGLGFANLAGSLFSSFPVAGGLSRTALNYYTGAKSGMASILSGAAVIIFLLIYPSIFFYMPTVILASIIIYATASLVDYKQAIYLFRIKPIDGVTLLVTFIATLAAGIEAGLFSGIIFSLLVFIWRKAHPYTTELGFDIKHQVFRDIHRHTSIVTYNPVVIFRIDSSIFFANMGFIEEKIREATINKKELKWVILDFTGVNDIDAASIKSLDEIIQAYLGRGIRFVFAGMKGPVRDLTRKAGWDRRDGIHLGFLTVRHALHELDLWEHYKDQEKSH